MQSFNLKIITLDGVKFDGPAESILVRTHEGDVAVMANHIDYVTSLGIGMAIVRTNGEKRLAACNSGVLSVFKGEVTVLASTFEWAEEISLERLEKAIVHGKEELSHASTGWEIEMAKRRISRALARKTVADSINK